MSQNVYYSEWQGELGTYRIEFYAASDAALTSPVYIEIPEDVVVVEKYNIEFGKYPVGLAKAPILEFKVKLRNALDCPEEFKNLFLRSAKAITWGNLAIWSTNTVYTGTVVKLSISSLAGSSYFVGVVGSDTDVDMNRVNGEISVVAMHWLKLALDSINFSGFAPYLQIGGFVEFAPGITEFEYRGSDGDYRRYEQIKDGYFVGFCKKYRLFDYLTYCTGLVKRAILRTDSDGITIPYADVKYYAIDPLNALGIGSSIPINDIYLLVKIANEDGSEIYGGLAYDPNGLQRYKSAWDFLADYYESTLSRVYISTFNELRIRTIFGSYGMPQDEVEIDEDVANMGKLRVNYSPLSTVVGSCIESIGSDVGKYENSRTASRNSAEFTLPIVFNNVPAAVDYQKKSKNTWRTFNPHIWGVYFKGGVDYYKCHHYLELPLSSEKWSSFYPECQYDSNFDGSLLFVDQLQRNPKTAMILLQRNSGAPKWVSAILRKCYDRIDQQLLGDIELLMSVVDVQDCFRYNYSVDYGDLGSGTEMSDDKHLPLSFTLDFSGRDSEKCILSLVSVDKYAI